MKTSSVFLALCVAISATAQTTHLTDGEVGLAATSTNRNHTLTAAEFLDAPDKTNAIAKPASGLTFSDDDFAPKPAAAQSAKNKIPSWWTAAISDPSATNKIVTLGGITYKHAKVTRFEPDGLTIKYLTDGGGIGGVKISFENLPSAYAIAYRYTPEKALEYENELEKQAVDAQVKAEIRQRKEAQRAAQVARLKYEIAKEQYENDIKLQALDAQQRAAAAQEQMAFIASQQQMQDAMNAQANLFEIQEQTSQQRKIANTLQDINFQYQMNSIYSH